jgi:hypothetical protein
MYPDCPDCGAELIQSLHDGESTFICKNKNCGFMSGVDRQVYELLYSGDTTEYLLED